MKEGDGTGWQLASAAINSANTQVALESVRSMALPKNGSPARQTQNATDCIDRSDRRLPKQSFDAVRKRELKRRLRARLLVAEGRPFCSAFHVRGS